MLYRVCTLDVTPENEINDAYTTADTVELGESPTVKEVCDALKEVERMAPDWPESGVTLQDDGPDYLVCDETGRKKYLLRNETPANGV